MTRIRAAATGLALALAGLSIGGTANAALLHQYRFDGGTTVVDSVGGVNGTLFGDAAIVNGALSLDGVGDYAELAGKIIPAAGDFTLTFFANEVQRNAGYVEMVSQGLSGNGFYIGYDPSHNIRVTDGSVITGIAFPAPGFHHYALAVSGNTGTFYIDGVSQGAFTVTRGPTGTDTRFGMQFVPYAEFFNGQIDDVLLYGEVLSAAEIDRLSDAGRSPVPTTTPPTGVPVPGTLALLLAGGAALRLRTRRT